MVLDQFAPAGVLLLIAIALTFIILNISRVFGPHNPTTRKTDAYESGMAPIGPAVRRLPVKFYLVGVLFILFDVEVIFLFPWATVFGQETLVKGTQGLWGWFSLVEMFIFIGILAMGLAYAWAKGFLDWIKPRVSKPVYRSHIPKEVYEQVSERYAVKK